MRLAFLSAAAALIEIISSILLSQESYYSTVIDVDQEVLMMINVPFIRF